MVAYLLDTNIVSELRKPAPNPELSAWHRRNRDADAYISVLVIAEIRRGIERVRPRDPSQASALERWLAALTSSYVHRTLPVSADVADEWGRLSARNPPPPIDGLMAATAKVHGLTLVTRNVNDVARTGVALLNPFTP
jgi:predicted nucleic acid-binding protein